MSDASWRCLGGGLGAVLGRLGAVLGGRDGLGRAQKAWPGGLAACFSGVGLAGGWQVWEAGTSGRLSGVSNVLGAKQRLCCFLIGTILVDDFTCLS